MCKVSTHLPDRESVHQVPTRCDNLKPTSVCDQQCANHQEKPLVRGDLSRTSNAGRRPLTTHRDHNEVRSNFYQKLGLLSKSRPPTMPQRQPSFRRQSSSSSSSSSSLRNRKNRDPRQAGNVSFKQTVNVITIPSHRDYDMDTWLQLWDLAPIAKQNKRRSSMEFASDGNMWELATEEKDMLVGRDGSLLHPATYWSDARYRPAKKWELRRFSLRPFQPPLLEMEPPCGCRREDRCIFSM